MTLPALQKRACANFNKRKGYLILWLSHLSILNQKLLDSILNMTGPKETQADQKKPKQQLIALASPEHSVLAFPSASFFICFIYPNKSYYLPTLLFPFIPLPSQPIPLLPPDSVFPYRPSIHHSFLVSFTLPFISICVRHCFSNP